MHFRQAVAAISSLCSVISAADIPVLTASEIMRFHADGYAVVRNVIPAKEIELLVGARSRHPFSWWLRPLELLLDQMTARFLTWDGLWLEQREYRSFWLDDGRGGRSLAPMIASLVHDERSDGTVRLLTDIIYGIKKGSAPFVLQEWHTDSESFDILSPDSEGISIWIPLSDIDHTVDGGSLLVAKHSLVDEKQCQKGEAPGLVSDECNAHLDTIGNSYSFKVGDILVFTRHTYHRTQQWRENVAASDRFALVGRFTSGLAQYRTPVVEGFQKKNTCPHGLRNETLLHSPCFPQVFPALIAAEVGSIERGAVWVDSTDLHLFKSCVSKLPLYFSLFCRNVWDSIAAGSDERGHATSEGRTHSEI
jgi:hypothetical protein